MATVLSNRTPQPDDFIYDLNNDGLHCGPQTAQDQAHAPRSTVPILSNTTVPPPDFPVSLGGNLNNDGKNCGPPQPFVPPNPPQPPAPPCRPSWFPTQNTFGTLTPGSPDSPNRGAGYKSQQITFHGIAGNSICLFCRSSAFEPYIYLMDPSNTVVAQDDNFGYDGPADHFGNAAIILTLASTGTYTVDCTTENSGQTGAFQLQISAGIENTVNQVGGVWALLDLPSDKRIHAVSGHIAGVDPGTGIVTNENGYYGTYDETDYTTILSTLLGTTGLHALIGHQNIFYNPNDGSVWALIRPDGATANGHWKRWNPVTGALLEDFDAGFYGDGVYAVAQNKFYWVNPTFTAFMGVYDVGSRSLTVNAVNMGTTDQQNIDGYCYDPVTNNVVVNIPSHAIYKISPTYTVSVLSTTQMNADPFFQIVGRTAYGLADSDSQSIVGVNLDTGSSSTLAVIGISSNGPNYNVCLDCLEVITSTLGTIEPGGVHGVFGYSLVRFSRSTGAFIEAKLFYVAPVSVGGAIELFTPEMVWNTSDTRTMIALNTNDVTDTRGFISLP